MKDFAHLGSRDWRLWWLDGRGDTLPEVNGEKFLDKVVFEPAPLDENTVLLDPFDSRFTLLGNRQGAIKRAWRITPAAGPGFAFVETEAGYYLGVLSEVQNLAESQMTWEQLTDQRSGAFALEKTGGKTLSGNAAIFQMDGEDPLAARLLASPDSLRVSPAHHRTLVEKGLPGLMLALDIPQTDAVEIPGGDPENFDHARETELKRVSVQLVTVSPDAVILNVTAQEQEREVQRRRNARGFVSTGYGPWRAKKVEKKFELERDADGGLRMTDGRVIYELSFPKIGGAQVATYAARENALSRALR